MSGLRFSVVAADKRVLNTGEASAVPAVGDLITIDGQWWRVGSRVWYPVRGPNAADIDVVLHVVEGP